VIIQPCLVSCATKRLSFAEETLKTTNSNAEEKK
jgi:hypothetical protein